MLTLLEPSALAPIVIGDVKAHLRIDTDAEDEVLENLIQAATALAEEYLGKTLIQKVWRWQGSGEPHHHAYALRIPRGPLIEISSVQRVLLNGTMSPIRYAVKNFHQEPMVMVGMPDEVAVCYRAGYGFYPKDIPAPIRHALVTLVAHLYDSRGGQMDVSPLVKTLLSPFRLIRMAV